MDEIRGKRRRAFAEPRGAIRVVAPGPGGVEEPVEMKSEAVVVVASASRPVGIPPAAESHFLDAVKVAGDLRRVVRGPDRGKSMVHKDAEKQPVAIKDFQLVDLQQPCGRAAFCGIAQRMPNHLRNQADGVGDARHFDKPGVAVSRPSPEFRVIRVGAIIEVGGEFVRVGKFLPTRDQWGNRPERTGPSLQLDSGLAVVSSAVSGAHSRESRREVAARRQCQSTGHGRKALTRNAGGQIHCGSWFPAVAGSTSSMQSRAGCHFPSENVSVPPATRSA